VSRGNLTRDPHHPLAETNYVRNMNKLSITVNGVKLDSRRVLNVYRVVRDKQPYVQMIESDSQGKIVTGEDGKLATYDVSGDIVVTGVPDHCACWRNRTTPDWWTRIDRHRGAW